MTTSNNHGLNENLLSVPQEEVPIPAMQTQQEKQTMQFFRDERLLFC